MKDIYNYIKEGLSKENIKRLEDYVNDGNIDNIIKLLKKNDKFANVNQDKYKEFFAKHGLMELNWGRKNSAIQTFTNLFNENENIEVLDKIVDNDGLVSINDMKLSGNIFDDYCADFKDEATTISFMTNSQSSNAGPFEILLKLIIKEAYSSKAGDVAVAGEMMEVKSVTLSKSGNAKSLSGGHAAGQKSVYNNDTIKNADVKIRMSWALNQIINQYGFNMDETEASKAAKDKEQNYFGKESAFNLLNKRLKSNKLNGHDTAELILNAILFQYQFKSNKKSGDGKYVLMNTDMASLIDYDTVLSEFIKTGIFTNDGITNQHDFLDAVGALQLYLYSIIEDFNYLLIAYLDKIEEYKNGEILKYNNFNSGHYILFRDLKKDNNLIHFSKTMEHLTFGTLDMPNSTQGRTGKMYFKNLKTWRS